MHNKNQQVLPGRLSVMSLSVIAAIAAMAAMAPIAAEAACITLSSNATVTGPTSTCLTWAGGNLSLTNNGTLNGPSSPQVQATGTLPGTLTNRGLISSGSIGVLNSGTISVVNNNGGAITGAGVALSGAAGSSIGTLTNTGRITGTTSGISLGSGARITSLFNNVSGTLTGTISGQTAILSSGGTISSLSNTGRISGTTLGISLLSGANLTSLLNNTGGTINGQTAISANNSTIGTLTNTGQITGTTLGIEVASGASITSLINNAGGAISGPTAIQSSGGSVGSLSNTGMISGTTLGISLLSGANFNSLLNNTGGTISGQTGISASDSTIGTLTNTGQINGTTLGIKLVSGGSTASLINNAGGTISGPTAILNSAGTIGSLANSGLISGSSYGLSNSSTIGLLNNSTGTITGTVGIASSSGTIGAINNGSVIVGSSTGISNSGGSVGTLTNTGTITGSSYAINVSTGTLGPIVNAGLIAGNIANASSNNLIIGGGGGSTFGILTGDSGGVGLADMGTITNTTSNVVFASGNQLLNNHVNVSGHALTNTGATLQVNNHIAVTGNYTQGAGATLLVGVADGATANGLVGDLGYGRLVVSGSATLASGSSVTLQQLNSYAFAAGQRFVVINALAAGTNYNASSLNYSAVGSDLAVRGTAVADGSNSNLVVTLSAPTMSSGATVPNAASALAGLSNYSGINNAGLLNLYNASLALSATGSTAEINRAGKQLNPNTQTSASAAAAAPTYDVLNIINRHTDGLRLSRAHGTGISTGESPSQYGVWGQAFGGRASQDQRNEVDGYRATYGGLLFGLDRPISDDWRVGGVFSYSNTTANNNGDTSGNRTKIDSYGLFAYGSYTAHQWYANVAGGIVHQNYDTSRAINLPGFSGNATGDFNGRQYVLRGEAGYPIPLGAHTVTPVAGLTYNHLRQDGYTESGGNGAALTVDSSSSRSVVSDIGAKLHREFTTSHGVLVPELRLAWRHEYNNDRVRYTSNFAGDPTGETSFTTLGASPVKNSALMSVGVTLLQSRDLSLSVRYDGQIGGGYHSNAGSIRLRKLF